MKVRLSHIDNPVKDFSVPLSIVLASLSSLSILAAPFIRIFIERPTILAAAGVARTGILAFSRTEIGLSYIAGVIGIILSVIITYNIYKRKEVKQILLLYAHKDLEVAKKIQLNLNKKGLKVLTDKDVVNVGDDISKTIEDTITKVDKIIILISENSSDSEWFKREIDISIKNKKTIYPILKDSKSKDYIKHIFKGVLYADLTNNYDKELEKLQTSLIK